jgi:hypothetical protein
MNLMRHISAFANGRIVAMPISFFLTHIKECSKKFLTQVLRQHQRCRSIESFSQPLIFHHLVSTTSQKMKIKCIRLNLFFCTCFCFLLNFQFVIHSCICIDIDYTTTACKTCLPRKKHSRFRIKSLHLIKYK